MPRPECPLPRAPPSSLLPLLRLLVAVLLPLAVADPQSRRLPSQEEANCPNEQCVCTWTKILCNNLNERSADVFLSFKALSFPKIDTIEVTGSRFGDMDDENLFGPGETHELVSLLNLTSNGITRIKPVTFEGLPNLEYLDLSRNKIVAGGRNTFGSMTRLKKIDLTSAFDAKRGSLEEVLSAMFAADQPQLTDLEDLILSKNAIQHLHPETFCQLQGLRRLHLNDNRLKVFSISKNCLPALEQLDLGGNELTAVPVPIWETLPSLSALDISSNPLVCDCQLQLLIDGAKDEEAFTNQGKTLCASPKAGVAVFDSKASFCSPSSSITLLNFFILLLIAGAVLFVYRFYRSQWRLPAAFSLGYSQLRSTEEAPAPQFV